MIRFVHCLTWTTVLNCEHPCQHQPLYFLVSKPISKPIVWCHKVSPRDTLLVRCDVSSTLEVTMFYVVFGQWTLWCTNLERTWHMWSISEPKQSLWTMIVIHSFSERHLDSVNSKHIGLINITRGTTVYSHWTCNKLSSLKLIIAQSVHKHTIAVFWPHSLRA